MAKDIKVLEIEIDRYLQTNQKPSRFEHTRRVMEMAVVLANRYGCDYEKAKIAALLHDVAKHFNRQEVQAALIKYGIQDKYLQKVPFLAHGEIGAALAKDLFEVDDEDILNAIRYHTYGRVGMSLLEKIIFIADYIEDGRDFNGVEIARKKAKLDLDDTLFFCVAHSLRYLIKKQTIVHPNSLELYNAFLEAQLEDTSNE